MRLLWIVTAALLLAACGERSEEPVAGERRYQGKPDTPAWGGGDRTAWVAEIHRRAMTQNEYERINR